MYCSDHDVSYSVTSECHVCVTKDHDARLKQLEAELAEAKRQNEVLIGGIRECERDGGCRAHKLLD